MGGEGGRVKEERGSEEKQKRVRNREIQHPREEEKKKQSKEDKRKSTSKSWARRKVTYDTRNLRSPKLSVSMGSQG